MDKNSVEEEEVNEEEKMVSHVVDREKELWWKKKRDFILNNLYVIFTGLMMEPVIFGFVTQNSQIRVDYYRFPAELSVFTSFISLGLLIGGMVFLVADYRESRDKRIVVFECKRPAYPVYLVGSYLFISLVTGVLFNYQFSIYVVLALSLTPLIVVVANSPYRVEEGSLKESTARISTVTAVYLQLMLVATVAILLANQLVTSEMLSLISSVVIIILLLAGVILTIIRMVKVIPWRELEIFKSCQKKKRKNSKQEFPDNGKKPNSKDALLKKDPLSQDSNAKGHSKNM